MLTISVSSIDVTVACTSVTARFEVNRLTSQWNNIRNGAALQISRVKINGYYYRISNFTQNSGSSFKVSHSAVTIDRSNIIAMQIRALCVLLNDSDQKLTLQQRQCRYSNVTVEIFGCKHNTAGHDGAMPGIYNAPVQVLYGI